MSHNEKGEQLPMNGNATQSTMRNQNFSAINGTSSQKRKLEVAMQDRGSADGWETVHYNRGKRVKQSRESKKYPAFSFSRENHRLQSKIKVGDLRDIVVYIMADGTAPQWISIKNRTEFRKFVVIVAPGLEEAMFKSNIDLATFDSSTALSSPTITSPDDFYPRTLKKEALPVELHPLADIFSDLWPVNSPGEDKGGRLYSAVGTFLTSQLSKREKEEAKAKRQASFKPVRTPITKFLASAHEFEDEGLPIHPAILDHEARKSFVERSGFLYSKVAELHDSDIPDTEIEQGSVTAGRKVLAIDCEMVVINESPVTQALARISIVDWSGDVVLDELVKPLENVCDYVTAFSGITKEMLENVTTSIHDIHKKLQEIVTPHTILVGHSLSNDLEVMKFSHPFVVDTSLIYPHEIGRKYKLRDLAYKFLRRAIQQGGTGGPGHDSIEDAKAALDLVRLKCEKGPSWGVPETTGVNLFERLHTAGTVYRAQGGPAATGGARKPKTSAVVDWHGETARNHGATADIKISCNNDEEVEFGVIRAVKGDHDGLEVPGGGVDFVFARMRELEFYREWNLKQPWKKEEAEPQVRHTMGSLGSMEEAEKKLSLVDHVHALSGRLKRIYDSLPPCTGLIVFTGGSCPHAQQELFVKRRQYNRETGLLSEEERTVKWTEKDKEALIEATRAARRGLGFLTVK